MAGKLRVSEKAIEYLKRNEGEKFTAAQIAQWIFQTYPSECEEKRRRSTQNLDDAALVEQLTKEVSGRLTEKERPQIKIIKGRTNIYYYSTQSDEDEAAQDRAGQGAAGVAHASVLPVSSSQLEERDLYPLLAQYLWSEFRVFSMRIEEKKSSNRHGEDGNRWLHPDIVGMEDLSAEWGREVRDCVSAYSDRRASLWSFEVKKKLNRSNVRAWFFQTLSNSSWANFAYLVAHEIREDAMKELRMLSAAHGIGLIRLDAENPYESEVLIPARERAAVDWDMVNRLAVENSDFRKFVGRVSRFCKTNDTQEWKQAIASEWGLSEED